MHLMQRPIDSLAGRKSWRKPMKYLILQESSEERSVSLDFSEVRTQGQIQSSSSTTARDLVSLTKDISARGIDLYPGGLSLIYKCALTVYDVDTEITMWSYMTCSGVGDSCRLTLHPDRQASGTSRPCRCSGTCCWWRAWSGRNGALWFASFHLESPPAAPHFQNTLVTSLLKQI